MPSGFVDDPEGDVTYEEVDDGGFGDDILAADSDSVDVLLLNVGQHHAAAVTDDLCRFVYEECVRYIFKTLLYVRSERILVFIRKSDIALCDGNGVHGLAVQQHLPLPGLGVEDPHGDFFSPCLSLFLHVNFYVLQADDISVGCGWTDAARNDAMVQHPRRLSLADVEHFVELFQGYFTLPQHISSPRFHYRQGACPASSPPRPWRWHPGVNICRLWYSYCCARDTSG